MSQSIAFIGGGQMAEALIKGLLQSKTYSSDQILVAEVAGQRRTYLKSTYQLLCTPDLTEIIQNAQAVVLAVKPQVMHSVLTTLKPALSSQLVITIAAGLPLSFYADHLGTNCGIIRVMPNMGALILEGASALCRNQKASKKDLQFAESLFSTVGNTVIVEEKLMDAVTGLSGSGPAYVFSFIEALIDGGVKAGLSRTIARALAIQTVLGAALSLKNSELHPAVLRDQVTSPGGTTASGLQVLESAGFSGTIISAVEAACNRSRKLGEG
jgi:pyrroline-5-carboxylate reductase